MPERNIRFFGDPNNMEPIFATLKKDPKYIGGDVGVGFKDRAWKVFDELEPTAEAMQSVNVVVKTPEGKLRGHNTDGVGYAKSLEDKFQEVGFDLRGRRVVILGGGGTARSIAFALADRGVQIKILNRTVAKAEELAQSVNRHFQKKIADFDGRDKIAEEAKNTDAIVSVIDDPTSPLYKYSALGNIVLPPTEEAIADNLQNAREIMQSMSAHVIISDVMLRDEETATIREAKRSGFGVLDGRPMVLNQAIEAFWLVNQGGLKEKNVTKEQVAEAMKRAAGS